MSLVGDQWVYVASCPSLPHLVKIGASTDCDQRESQLSDGMPAPFKIEKKWKVDDAMSVEKALHHSLDVCRVASNQEFFGMSIAQAIRAVSNVLRTGKFEEVTFDKSSARKMRGFKSIGRLIRYERLRQGLTQRQISLTTSTSLRLVGEIESGKATAQIGKVLKIMDVLRISTFCETQNV